MRIGRKRLYERGEVTDAMDINAGQDLKAQLSKVHPFVGGVLGGSVIEVEAIDVYVCPGCLNGENGPSKKQSRRTAARALPPKIEGVSTTII